MTDRTAKMDSAYPLAIPKLNDGYQAGLSKRELAAIMLRVPDSGTEWLDEMIRRSHQITGQLETYKSVFSS